MLCSRPSGAYSVAKRFAVNHLKPPDVAAELAAQQRHSSDCHFPFLPFDGRQPNFLLKKQLPQESFFIEKIAEFARIIVTLQR